MSESLADLCTSLNESYTGAKFQLTDTDTLIDQSVTQGIQIKKDGKWYIATAEGHRFVHTDPEAALDYLLGVISSTIVRLERLSWKRS